MGLLFRPRRPVLRLATGAATAALAYRAGKRRVTQDEYNQQAAAAYQATQGAPAAATPAPAPVAEDPTMAELNRLAQLHSTGVLTDAEFTAAKAKLLGI